MLTDQVKEIIRDAIAPVITESPTILERKCGEVNPCMAAGPIIAVLQHPFWLGDRLWEQIRRVINASILESSVALSDDVETVFNEAMEKALQPVRNKLHCYVLALKANRDAYARFDSEVSKVREKYRAEIRIFCAEFQKSMINQLRVTNITNNVNGSSARVNIGSTDNSVNVIGNVGVFDELRTALSEGVADERLRDDLMNAATDLQNAMEAPEYANRYARFIELAANHMTLIAPFIPPLSQLLLHH